MKLKLTLLLFIMSAFIAAIAQPPTQERMNQAMQAFDQGINLGIEKSYPKAIEAFTRAIDLNPIYAEAFLYRGLAKVEINEIESAIKDFTIAIELDPKFTDQAHYFRGLARAKKKDYHGAIQDYSIAVRLNPDFISFFQRGKANLELGEYQRSLQDFEIAIRLNPNFHEGFLYRGIALYHLGQFKDAREDIEKATANLSDNAMAFYYSGLVKTRIQNSYAAIEDLDRAIALDPQLADAYQARAQARTNTGNTAGATHDHVQAAQIAGGNRTETNLQALPEVAQPTLRSTTESPSTTATDIDFANLFGRSQTTSNTDPQPSNPISSASSNPPGVQVSGIQYNGAPNPSVTSSLANISSLSSGFYNKDLSGVRPGGFGVQVASYSSTERLRELSQAYEDKYKKPVFIHVSNVNGRRLYKIIIGQFFQRSEAELFRNNLRTTDFPDSFLVVFENL